MRQDITYPDMQKEVLPRLVRFTRPAPGMSTVLYSNLNEANADVEIEEQIAFFTANQLPFSWKMYAMTPRQTCFPGCRRMTLPPTLCNSGLYTTILSARVQEVIHRGRRYLVVDAGAQSRPIVARHGFVHLTDIHACAYTGLEPFISENPGTSN